MYNNTVKLLRGIFHIGKGVFLLLLRCASGTSVLGTCFRHQKDEFVGLFQNNLMSELNLTMKNYGWVVLPTAYSA